MTGEYKKSSHTIYKVELHIVWITKYRYKVLKGDIAIRTRDLIRRICNEENVDIMKGTVSPDHIHILVSMDPKISISQLLKFLKGKTSRMLQIEYPELKKRYWGQHLWARGYFVVSTGNVSTEMISEYIDHHFENKENPDDPFGIEMNH